MLLDEPQLPRLLAHRPQVHPVAPRLGVRGQQLSAATGRADAHPRLQLDGIGGKHGREHIANNTSCLLAVLGDPGPHRRHRGRQFAAPSLRQRLPQEGPVGAKPPGIRVIRRREPAVTEAGDPAQARRRAPAPYPQRDPLAPDRARSQPSVGSWLTVEHVSQESDVVVKAAPPVLEDDARRRKVGCRRAGSDPRDHAPPKSTSRAVSALASGSGPRTTGSATVVASSREPDSFATAVRAVRPSSQGREK